MTNHTFVPMDSLYDDLLFSIIMYLSHLEVRKLAATSKRFNALCTSDRIWKALYKKEFNTVVTAQLERLSTKMRKKSGVTLMKPRSSNNINNTIQYLRAEYQRRQKYNAYGGIVNFQTIFKVFSGSSEVPCVAMATNNLAWTPIIFCDTDNHEHYTPMEEISKKTHKNLWMKVYRDGNYNHCKGYIDLFVLVEAYYDAYMRRWDGMYGSFKRQYTICKYSKSAD